MKFLKHNGATASLLAFIITTPASLIYAGEGLSFPDDGQTTSSREGFWTRTVSSWSFSVNGSWQKTGNLSLSGRSQSGGVILPRLFQQDMTTDPAIGAPDGISARNYTDGFVNPSGFTEATGMTSFWGYDNTSQVSGNTIEFNATGERTQFIQGASGATGFSDRESLETFTPRFDLQFTPKYKHFNYTGILLSLSFSNTSDSVQFSDFSSSQSQTTFQRNFTDTFSQGGLIGNVPPAGFRGTFAGPGPLIPNIPESRDLNEFATGTETAEINNTVKSSAEISTISLTIGPTFEGTIAQSLRWQFSAGASVNLYHWDASQNESLSATLGGNTQILGTFRNRNSGTELGIGLYARAGLLYQIHEDWFLQGYLQGEIGTSFDFDAGPSSYEFDPNGYSIGFGIGRAF